MDPAPEKYYVTDSTDILAEDLLGANEGGKIYINQNGTKLKLTMPKEELGGTTGYDLDVADDVEFILHK
jgi:hypothetical protein